MLTERQNKILKEVVELYIRSAEPIGSELLLSETAMDVSGATMRNDMRALEDAGFLMHPHTSAGRVPTESGYRYYVKQLMQVEEPSKSFVSNVKKTTKDYSEEYLRQKTIARLVSEEIGNAVIIIQKRESIYYTGLSCLFSQPEFRDVSQTVSLSSVFDHFDEHTEAVLSTLSSGADATVHIGTENPLGKATSIVGICLGTDRAFLILGPLRMSYAKAVGVIQSLISI